SKGASVEIHDTGSSGNLIAGNWTGTDKNGTARLGSTGDAVLIYNGATGNTVGGISSAARNIISANAYQGVDLANSGTSGNLVEGNYIGTDITGTVSLPNSNGVVVQGGASNNTIGGAVAAARNIISGNNTFGVYVASSGTN